jgi:hypothetical protein
LPSRHKLSLAILALVLLDVLSPHNSVHDSLT